MELSTVGKSNPDRILPIWCNRNESFSSNMGHKNRYRLIYIHKGSGIIRIGNRRCLFNSPAIFCISETELIEVEEIYDLKAFGVYFSPDAINSSMNFEKVRSRMEDITSTERHDCSCLSAFFHRDEKYWGQINIGNATSKRISHLTELLDAELLEQTDGYWPCRSRAHLLELIFIIERLFYNPELSVDILLSQESSKVDRIILYLHTNYSRKITISEITNLFYINRNTLREQFIEATGLPVMAYLIRLRMRIASILLKDTEIPVCEVMERVGYADLTHFGRAYKASFGVTPSEYRKKYC